jgi:dihydropteroate synthase
MKFAFRGNEITLNRTFIMGILNVTPDSFSDGGMFLDPEAAAKRAEEMVKDGADIIDIGGESTKPGSQRVSAEEEIKRVVPVIRAIRNKGISIPVSIDTYKSIVAKEAVLNGADIINDISGGLFDPEMFKTASYLDAGYILMHIKGTIENMQKDPVYSGKGVISDIKDFFRERLDAALKAGIYEGSIVIDPGIGFGKTLKNNFEIIDRLGEFKEFKRPLLIGTSRKSMIGKVLDAVSNKRLFGTAASVALSIIKGADMIRVHDVREIKDVAKMCDAMINYKEMEG